MSTGTSTATPVRARGPARRLSSSELRRLAAVGLVIVILGALGGVAVSLLRPPQYVGRTTVLYILGEADSSGFLREDRNLTTQTLLAQSPAVLGPAAARTGQSADDLAQRTSVSVAPGSELITIDVRGSTPQAAVAAAGAVTAQYLTVSSTTQPAAAQGRFLQSQLDAVNAQIGRLQAARTPAALGQLPAVSQRQSTLQQQLDQVNLGSVVQPAAHLVGPAAPAGEVPRGTALDAAAGLVLGLVVALVTVGLLARRRHRRPRDP